MGSQADCCKLSQVLEVGGSLELLDNGRPADLVVGVSDVHFNPNKVWTEFKEEPHGVNEAGTATRSEGDLVRLQVLPEGSSVDLDDLLLQSSPKSTLDPKRPEQSGIPVHCFEHGHGCDGAGKFVELWGQPSIEKLEGKQLEV